MSNERWIDGNALLARLSRLLADALSPGERSMASTVVSWIEAAPTLQPAAVDAISRAWLLDRTHDTSFIWGRSDARRLVEEAPSLPVAAPDVDVVRAEEIVEGIEWNDGQMCPMVIAVNKHSASVVNSDRRGMDSQWFSKKAVAAMLNAAESVTWPEGHPRNPTKPNEPTLLEAAEALMEVERGIPPSDDEIQCWNHLKAAIEAERKGEGK